MAFFLSPPPHLHAFISACRFHLNSQLQRISRKPLRSPNPTKTHSFKTTTTYSFESMKMEKIRAPYGSWKPPITAELSLAPPSYSVALPLIPSATSSGSSHAPMLGGLGEGRWRTAMHYWTLQSVPPAQARNIYHALKEKGLPVALVEYEGEQHGFRKAEAESIKFTLEQQIVVFARLVGRSDEITPTRIDNFD